MTDPQKERIEAILAGLFLVQRESHQRQGIEDKRSIKKPELQVPSRLDFLIDLLCKELGLKNPGTDGHSLNCWPHPVDGWPPETEERMRKQRVRMSMERGVVGQDEAWLKKEGLTLAKSGWVRSDDSYHAGEETE